MRTRHLPLSFSFALKVKGLLAGLSPPTSLRHLPFLLRNCHSTATLPPSDGTVPTAAAAAARDMEPETLQTRFLQTIFLLLSLTVGVSVDFSEPAATLVTWTLAVDVLPFLSSAVTVIVCAPSASLPEPCHGARPTGTLFCRPSVKLRISAGWLS